MGNQDRTKNMSIVVENDEKVLPYMTKSTVNPAMKIKENVAAFVNLTVNSKGKMSKRRRSCESLENVSTKSLKTNDETRYNCPTNNEPLSALTIENAESDVPDMPCPSPQLNNRRRVEKISCASLLAMNKSYRRKRSKSKDSICHMCQRVLSLSIRIQSSACCLQCPFICYLKFPNRESLRNHILSAHIICGCKYQHQSASSIDFNRPLTHNCPLCDKEFPQCNSLEPHLFSGHDFNFFDTYPVKNDEPNYMIIPEDLFSAKKNSWNSDDRSGLSGNFICDICAIKFSSIRELFHHFDTTNHKMNIQEMKEFRGDQRQSDTDETISDISQSPLEMLHQQNRLKTYKRSTTGQLQEDAKLEVTNNENEDCDVAMDDLMDINDQEASVKPSTPDDSMDEYEGYEYLESDDPEEPLQTTSPSPTESLESLDNLKDPHSFPSIPDSLLTPDTTATDSTASEEPKLSSIPSPALHKSPKIIGDSRTFDEQTLLYLEKLQKDHKSLNNVRSMLMSQATSPESPLPSKSNLKKVSLSSPPILQPLPTKTPPEPATSTQYPKKDDRKTADSDPTSQSHKTSNNNNPKKELLARSCPKCKKLFDSTIVLAKHLNLVQQLENTANPSQKCPKCFKIFKNHHVLETHKYLIHQDSSGIHFCDNCCTILTTTSMVNDHECTSTSSFSCKPCKETFTNSKELLRHNQTHHLETSGPHSCRVCQKNFLTKSMMTRHTVEDICTKDSKMVDATESNNNDNDTGQNLNPSVLHFCNTCQLFYPTLENIQQHLETVHDHETCKLCCSSCHKKNILNHIVKNHILISDVATLSTDGETQGDIDVYEKGIMRTITEYLRYEKSRKSSKIICLICNLPCPDVDHFKLHYVEDHDNCCILCYKEFDRVSEAVEHKSRLHKSLEIYVWVVTKILSAFSESK